MDGSLLTDAVAHANQNGPQMELLCQETKSQNLKSQGAGKEFIDDVSVVQTQNSTERCRAKEETSM